MSATPASPAPATASAATASTPVYRATNALRAVYTRELQAYFLTPLAYVFIAIFLIAIGAFTFEIGRFFERTGIPSGNVRFCRRRPDKAVHCRELAVTHFVDDRLDVHEALREVVTHRYLFGERSEPAPDWVEHTPDWPSVEAAIVRDTGGVTPPRS